MNTVVLFALRGYGLLTRILPCTYRLRIMRRDERCPPCSQPLCSCMSVKKTDWEMFDDSADSPDHSIVLCLPKRRGQRHCSWSFSLPLRLSSTTLYPSSVNNAVDFITIPSTSSFTQERLWSDISRTQLLHKALLLLHWMATNPGQNTKSGQWGIMDREGPQAWWVQPGYLIGEENEAQSG